MKKLLLIMIIGLTYLFASTILVNDDFKTSSDGYKYFNTNQNVSTKDQALYLNKYDYAYKFYNLSKTNYNSVIIEIKFHFKYNTNKDFMFYLDGVLHGPYGKDHVLIMKHHIPSNGIIKLYLLNNNPSNPVYVDYVKILYSDNPRDFTLYRSDNIHGDVTMIGNSVLEQQNGKCPNLRTQNNDIVAVYADKDNDPNTYNSTWATLHLPAGINSKNIVYALLYWQGRTSSNDDAEKYGQTVKLKLFGSSNYTTVTSIPDKFNYIAGDYQGVSDVTDLLKQSINSENSATLLSQGYQQKVWVANVFTNANGYNLYGAWSLIVVYKDANAHLKNITLYDGYDEVYDNSKSYNLPGFLTPTRGVVNAKFMVFAGEGDVLYPDNIFLTDKNGKPISLGEDFFRSSEDVNGVNITDRDPNCANTIGIDLRTRSVGTNAPTPIIGNGQTSTTVTLSSQGDQYFPGVFIFSTDLYEPRVCYYIDKIVDKNNQTIYADKQFLAGKSIQPNEDYKVSFWIANMKQNPADEDIEDAKKVQVFLDTSDFNYTKSSTYIQNIGDLNFSHKTDIKDTDIFETTALNKYEYRLGLGANGTNGGEIDVANNFNDNAKKAFIDLNGTFILNSDQQTINLDDVFHFKAAFATTSLTISPDQALPIPKCVDFNSQGNVFIPANGNFNVVNKNFTGNTDPITPQDPKNALYTQVANKSFLVKVLSLENDYQTLKDFTGYVNVELIPTPNYQASDTDSQKTQKCEDAQSLAKQSIFFDNQSSQNLSFIYPKINKNVTFRISTFKDNGCSSYKSLLGFTQCMYQYFQPEVSNCTNECINLKDTNGARNCIRCMFRNRNLTTYTCARDNFAIRPDHFEITGSGTNRADNNISFLQIKAVDAKNNVVDYNENSSDLNLSAKDINPSCYSATPSANFTFQNGIAKINFIKYPEVGDIKLSLSEQLGKEFAIVDKNDTPDSDRLINKGVSNAFRVLPDHFKIYDINFNNFNNSSFTYLSKDLNMSGILNAIIEAQNANNNITYNYSANCYAKNVDINITHSSNTNMNHLNQILTQYSSNPKNSNISFTWNKNNFINGDANLNLKINFDRNYNKGDEVAPFTLTLNDINVTDEDDTNGSSQISQSINYLYGRVFSEDISTINNEANLTIFFQKYDGSKWVTNSLHNNKIYGDVNNTFTTSNINVNLNESNINKEQNLSISPNTNNRPYKVRLHLNIPTWLWYSLYNKKYIAPDSTHTDCTTHPCNNILFLGNASKKWAGVGTGENDNNVTKNTINSKIRQNTKKNNDFHKLNW